MNTIKTRPNFNPMKEEKKFLTGIVSGRWAGERHSVKIATQALSGYLKSMPNRVKWDAEMNVPELVAFAENLLLSIEGKKYV